MTPQCLWCGDYFTASNSRGPTPRYCRQAHRQRAYEARLGFGALRPAMVMMSMDLLRDIDRWLSHVEWVSRDVDEYDRTVAAVRALLPADKGRQ